MSEKTIMRYSMDEIEAKLRRGEDRTVDHSPALQDAADELPSDFWTRAVIAEPKVRKSVHLRLQADVFDFFIKQTDGKGHIAKMQAVLKAYADAHR